jgi:threonine aldolase
VTASPSAGFASDNSAGVHPAVMDALLRANTDPAIAYGDDPWTARATAALAELVGGDAQVFLALTGTGANVLGLQAMLRPYEAIICTSTAHVHYDECGAPERHTGCKLLDVDSPDGKLTPELVLSQLIGVGDQHHVQARVVSISQTTELGTVYQPDEVAALCEVAHANGLLVHLDGARIANATAALGGDLRAFTSAAGVDVLSFGGTKNGLLAGEAVVLLRPELAGAMPYLRKQGMQLASKMRFVAAQFEALLADGLWLENAAHANAMARRLRDAVEGSPGLELAQPVQANAVFHDWDESRDEVRWMTSFATTPDEVDAFAAAIRDALDH